MASQYYKKYHKLGTEQHLQNPCPGFNSFIEFCPRQSMMLAFSPNSVHSFVKKFRLKFFQARKMKSVESQSNFFPAIFRNFLVSIKKRFLSLLKIFCSNFLLHLRIAWRGSLTGALKFGRNLAPCFVLTISLISFWTLAVISSLISSKNISSCF